MYGESPSGLLPIEVESFAPVIACRTVVEIPLVRKTRKDPEFEAAGRQIHAVDNLLVDIRSLPGHRDIVVAGAFFVQHLDIVLLTADKRNRR